ncbi:VWA domain-containing protein [Gilvimarinus polysaccharolyticus]|uniref:VWA domain-containing protein n=1 Tax=Gilvimarinus polysaccharolyticus TaxID=863921 RepID=UPI000673B490|nr:VWA domain-containing protein [Gilvimarinus polysaccharolyticus]
MSWLAEFHFLRPWALLLIIVVAIIIIALWRTRVNHSRWQQLIAPELLVHLIDGESQRQSRKGIIILALALVIACLALAGPAWERQSSPVHRQANALIIALDLSPSMVAEDVKPRRLVRARLKIADFLKNRDEGETALIVYADDAHLVTPLTDDTRTIAALLPTLTPAIMPMLGSRPEAAVTRALKMFNDAGYDRGHILLVTDGITDDAADEINKALKDSGIRLLILGVGTDAGAPIPSGTGGFIRDANNNVVITRLGSAQLQKLAQKNGGRYITNTIDQQDIEYLNPSSNLFDRTGNDDTLKQKMDQWLDRGPWLVLLLLPILLLSFRRGVVVAVLLLPLLSLQSPPLQAATLDNPLDAIFLTPDQRGAKALGAGDAASAAETFNDPLWKGTAQYRAGDYEAAANSFAEHDSALAHYNRGNALAQTGKLDDAIKAYKEALKLDPDMEDAKANQQLIEQLKQQQEQQNQQEQDQSGDDSSDSEQQSSEQQAQDEQQKGEQNNESENNSDESQSGASSSSPANPSESQQDSQQDPGQSDQQNSAASSNSSSGKSDEPSAEGQSSSASSAEGEGQNEQQESSSSAAGNADEESENAEKNEQELEAQAQPLTPEEQEARQATEQWLRQIPDDPSGLLRNKFRYEYEQQRQDRQQKKLNTFGNSEQRW